MEIKKVFVLLGHTDSETFSGALTDAYEKGARAAGHQVERINVGDLHFDPVLHKGYKVIQELEPDLKRVQETIKWADHIAIFYPNWWGTMPAYLKGMFDRMYLPGFAFRFRKESALWDKLLKGKSACVYITMNTNPLLAQFFWGDNSNEIRRNILEFAGISPVRLVKIGPVEKMAKEKLDKIITRTEEAGRNVR